MPRTVFHKIYTRSGVFKTREDALDFIEQDIVAKLPNVSYDILKEQNGYVVKITTHLDKQ